MGIVAGHSRFTLAAFPQFQRQPDSAAYAAMNYTSKDFRPESIRLNHRGADSMKLIPFLLVLAASISTYAEEKKPVPTLKSILLEQLRTTHTQKEWFVPVNVAVDGLTAEQANWKDGKGNHSVGELVSHLVYWNSEELAKFKG